MKRARNTPDDQEIDLMLNEGAEEAVELERRRHFGGSVGLARRMTRTVAIVFM